MIHEKPRAPDMAPTSSDRSFGFVFAIFFLIIALLPLLQNHEIRNWALVLSAIFGLTALLMPAILAPLNSLWTKFGFLLHLIVSPLALGVLFYGVVVPTGLILRLWGKNLLNLRFDPNAESYWIKRDPPGPDADSLNNQF